MLTVATAMTVREIKAVSKTNRPSCSRIGMRIVTPGPTKKAGGMV